MIPSSINSDSIKPCEPLSSGHPANGFSIEEPNPLVTARSEPPAQRVNRAATTAQSDRPLDVHKAADDELAEFLTDVHRDIGLWRPLSNRTSVGKWLDLFNQSWGAPAMQAWMKAQHFVPRSLRLLGSTLTAQSIVDGKTVHRTFTPADGSGWWPIGRQAIASAAVLDLQKSGLVGGSRAVLWPENVAAFYGLTWPLSNAQAGELRGSGFPVGAADDPLRSSQARELASRDFMDTEQEAALIKTLLDAIKDKPVDEKIDLGAISQAITPGSSFAIANKSNPQLLKNMRDSPRMQPILQACQADWTAQLRLVDGELLIKSRGRKGQWNNVTEQVKAKPELAQLLDEAIEQAKRTGNVINSGAKADARQLLRFAGMDELPSNITVSELQNLLNWKLNPVPPGPLLGSYARDFLADSQSPDYLSTEQRVRVRHSASAAGAEPKLMILDCSPQPWSGKTLEQVRENADELITKALAQGEGLRRCEPILTALKDNPSAATVDASPGYRQQMILTRDLLCIDPELGLKRNHIAGYNLYSVANTGKTLFEVRAELEQYIGATQQIPMNQAVLVTHALLATVAPEFLVKGAGEERVGSLALVNLRIQTALVELASQGSSRDMSTEQVSSRAVLTPVSSEQQQLHAVESVGPIYDWALTQGVVSPEEDYSPSAVQRALTSYNQRLDAYTLMNSDLDNALSVNTTRFEAGRQEFERVCPGNSDFFQKATIYVEPDSAVYKILKAGLPFSLAGAVAPVVENQSVSTFEHIAEASSLYDLYASGVLTAENASTREWKFVSPQDQVKFESLTSQLSNLKPINRVFDSKFNAGINHLENFRITSTRVMMSEMPLEDRLRLAFGEVFVFGAAAPQPPDSGELTQAQAQQKMGPIVVAQDASGAQCYEFLPSTNSYILRPELLASMGALIKIDTQTGRITPIKLKRHHPTLPAAIDIKGYFPAKARDPNGSPQAPNTYSSKRTNQLIQVFKDNGMFVSRELMLARAKGTTRNESIQQSFDAAEAFIINTLIPLKSNIEDIVSGDPKRVAMGALGLGLEFFGALFVVGGAVSKAAKGATIAFKLGQLAKAALSMFNLPGAVVGTGRSLFRLSSIGVRSLVKAGPATLSKGLANFRKLVSGGRKHSQSQIWRSRKPWTAEDTTSLLGNTGLINTGIGTNAYFQQPVPVPSPGSTITART